MRRLLGTPKGRICRCIWTERGPATPAGASPPSHINNYKAVVLFEGTTFCGWQLQRRPGGKRSVQEVVETALIKKHLQPHRDELRLQAASRTDSGVHAEGQVINFFSRQPISCEPAALAALNKLLPPEVQLGALQRVPADFSARYSATGKLYHYSVQTGQACNPLLRGQSMHCPGLDLDLVRQTAGLFLGEHNFTHCSNLAELMGAPRDPVKTITQCTLVPEPWGFRLEIAGRGFLYKQVRHMAGAAIAVGLGKTQLSNVKSLLEGGAHKRTGPMYRGWDVAPAHGLCLKAVSYPPHEDWQTWLHPEYAHDKDGRVVQEPRPEVPDRLPTHS